MRYTQGADAESAAGRNDADPCAGELPGQSRAIDGGHEEEAAPQPEIHADLLYPARRVLSTAYRIKV